MPRKDELAAARVARLARMTDIDAAGAQAYVGAITGRPVLDAALAYVLEGQCDSHGRTPHVGPLGSRLLVTELSRRAA